MSHIWALTLPSLSFGLFLNFFWKSLKLSAPSEPEPAASHPIAASEQFLNMAFVDDFSSIGGTGGGGAFSSANALLAGNDMLTSIAAQTAVTKHEFRAQCI